MPNPNVPQGDLNKLVASVNWPSNTQLNVTPPFLGRAGISYTRDGEATKFLPSMTGLVTSNEVVLMVTLSINLLKPQSLCTQYEKRLKTNTKIGNGTVRPDVTTGLAPIDIYNCAIENVRDLSFNGDSPDYIVIIRGYEIINNDLWP